MPPSSIVIFGEALVDLFKDNAVVGGAPFNVARHLAGLGLHPLFISAIGKDNAGVMIEQEIKRYQLEPLGVQVLPEARTGYVQVHENAQGHQFEIMPDCAYDYIHAETAMNSLRQHTQRIQERLKPLKSVSSLLYQGTLGLRNSCSRNAFNMIEAELASQPRHQIFIDLNWREGHVDQGFAMHYLSRAHVIKVSIEELEMLFVWFNLLVSIKYELPKLSKTIRPVQALMSSFNAKLLLVTYGDLGSAAFNNQGACIAVSPAMKHHRVVDTVGAGDAFSSVMLLALYLEWPLEIALSRANEFAADVCGIRGATPSSLDFYEKYITAWHLSQAVESISAS